jgi:ABC-type polysaccharide/polyol phosphate export permease
MCPPEIFPAVTLLSHLVHHLLALPVLLAAMVASSAVGWHPFPWTFFLVPVALIPWLLLAGGVVLAVSALSVHYRDLRDLLGHLLNLLFFASPIIYSLEGLQVPTGFRRLLLLNPLAPLIQVYRDVVFAGEVSAPSVWAAALLVGVLAWWLGTWIFDRHRDTLVESV